MLKWFFAVPIIALLILGFGLIANNTTNKSEIQSPGVKGNIETYFCVDFKPANGEWISLGCQHNVFTNAGRNHVKGLLGGTITTDMHTKYLALGNGTAPTATSTSLNNEVTGCGLNRKLGDYYSLGDGWWEVNTTFTYTCSGSLLVNTTGAFNQASAGTFFAGGEITPVTFTTNGDQLRLRHNNTISEA